MVRSTRQQKHKLAFRWTGPMGKMIAKSENSFLLEDCKRAQYETRHAHRMLAYNVQLKNDAVSKEVMHTSELLSAGQKLDRDLDDEHVWNAK